MGYVLDLIILAIIVVCVLISRKRGFIKSVVELAGFILAIILAFNLGPTLANVTYEGIIRETVSSTITNAIGDTAQNISASVTDNVWGELPDIVKNSADKFDVSRDDLEATLNSSSGSSVQELSLKITDDFVKPFTVSVLKIVFGIIIFLIVAIVAKIISNPISKLFSISFVGKINKLLGALLGLGKGVVFSILFCAIVSTIIVFTKSGFLIFNSENIEASFIFKFLCSINPIY